MAPCKVEILTSHFSASNQFRDLDTFASCRDCGFEKINFMLFILLIENKMEEKVFPLCFSEMHQGLRRELKCNENNLIFLGGGRQEGCFAFCPTGVAAKKDRGRTSGCA